MNVSYRKAAKGTMDPSNRTKAIAVRFDAPVFDALSTEADRRKMPFAELVRYYVGLGMDAENGTRKP